MDEDPQIGSLPSRGTDSGRRTVGPAPFQITCPTCGAPNIVHVADYNCCFECGQKMFVSPIEQEALSGDPGRPAAKKRESHGAYAVEMTFKVVTWTVGIGFGLYVVGWTWPILLAGAIVLLSIYLFFNVWSRMRGRKLLAKNTPEAISLTNIRLDTTPDDELGSPEDCEPGRRNGRR